jgi:uncharacterized repeat protein (TIGR02543 family)
MAGCLLDLGDPRRNDGQETQPKAGVLTVIGAKDGVSYEAEVYDYPDDDVEDAADLADLMSVFEMAGTGLDMPGEEALAIELLTPDGEYFTADGDFLVVLRDETDAGAPLRYKAAVPFTGGSATLKYSTMKTAKVEPSVSIYTVTFYLNDGSGKAHASQTVAHNGKAVPAANPTRTDYDFDNWYAPNAEAPYNFNSPVTAGLDLLAKWKPLTFAAVIADMAENKGTAAKT